MLSLGTAWQPPTSLIHLEVNYDCPTAPKVAGVSNV